MNTYELELYAVMFRTLDPNLGHVDTLAAMNRAGLGFLHGNFMAIPRHQRRRRRALANTIAAALDKLASVPAEDLIAALQRRLPAGWVVQRYGSRGCAAACFPPGGPSADSFRTLDAIAPAISVCGPQYVVSCLRVPESKA